MKNLSPQSIVCLVQEAPALPLADVPAQQERLRKAVQDLEERLAKLPAPKREAFLKLAYYELGNVVLKYSVCTGVIEMRKGVEAAESKDEALAEVSKFRPKMQPILDLVQMGEG